MARRRQSRPATARDFKAARKVVGGMMRSRASGIAGLKSRGPRTVTIRKVFGAKSGGGRVRHAAAALGSFRGPGRVAWAPRTAPAKTAARLRSVRSANRRRDRRGRFA